MVRQNIERFWTKLADLRIPPDIRYVRMTDIERALTIYGHRANLLNNKKNYVHLCLERLTIFTTENYLQLSKRDQLSAILRMALICC